MPTQMAIENRRLNRRIANAIKLRECEVAHQQHVEVVTLSNAEQKRIARAIKTQQQREVLDRLRDWFGEELMPTDPRAFEGIQADPLYWQARCCGWDAIELAGGDDPMGSEFWSWWKRLRFKSRIAVLLLSRDCQTLDRIGLARDNKPSVSEISNGMIDTLAAEDVREVWPARMRRRGSEFDSTEEM
jgi:hypothetical protein